jgi:glycerol-1-phosphatase
MGRDSEPAPDRAVAAAPPRGLKSCPQPLTAQYDCAMLDLDGVVYLGEQTVTGAPEALATARGRGMTVAFVTNNASRTPDAVAARLAGLGVPAAPADVVTSAQVAAREVADRVPPGAPVLVIGAEGLRSAIRAVGLKPVDSGDNAPAAVVQGLGPDVGWRQLSEAAVAIRGGALWVASNTDLTVPTSRGLAPGNGAFVKALAAAVGSDPQVVAGKPYRPLFDETIRRTGARAPLVVGDRLDTDIEGAANCGVDSLLVMTGVTDVATLVMAPPRQRPSYVSFTLQGLLSGHDAPARAGVEWQLAGWTASVVSGELRIGPIDRDEASATAPKAGLHPDDGLRVAAAAAWQWCDANSGEELRCDAAISMLNQLG